MYKLFIPLLCVTFIFSSCKKEEEISGCRNSSALNFNPEANLGDGSCMYFFNGVKCSSTSDGGYIFGGKKGIPYTDKNISLYKTDVLGNQEWIKEYQYYWNNVFGSFQSNDGGFILIGSNLDGISVLKTDANGNELLYNILTSSMGSNGTVKEIKEVEGGGFIIVTSDEVLKINRHCCFSRRMYCSYEPIICFLGKLSNRCSF